jgi:two-component system response regulator AlgR
MALSILIVDDEELARSRLRSLLADIPGNRVVAEASSGREALHRLEQTPVDVVLLDISMPGINGIEVARHVRNLDHAPSVIFCTAHDEHALEAFDARAIDYLTKPVRRERLEAALQRAAQLKPPPANKAVDAPPWRDARTHLCARVRGNLKLVPVRDVSYFLAEDKYVTAHHAGGELLLEEALKDLEAEFAQRFVRVHRNCLVALDRIVALTRDPDGRVLVQMRPPDPPLEVSRRNLPSLRQRMKTL